MTTVTDGSLILTRPLLYRRSPCPLSWRSCFLRSIWTSPAPPPWSGIGSSLLSRSSGHSPSAHKTWGRQTTITKQTETELEQCFAYIDKVTYKIIKTKTSLMYMYMYNQLITFWPASHPRFTTCSLKSNSRRWNWSSQSFTDDKWLEYVSGLSWCKRKWTSPILLQFYPLPYL